MRFKDSRAFPQFPRFWGFSFCCYFPMEILPTTHEELSLGYATSSVQATTFSSVLTFSFFFVVFFLPSELLMFVEWGLFFFWCCSFFVTFSAFASFYGAHAGAYSSTCWVILSPFFPPNLYSESFGGEYFSPERYFVM